MIGDRIRQRVSPAAGAGAAELRKVRAVRAAEYAVRFLFGLALSGARIFDTLSPFAIGLIASSGGVPGAVAALLGSVMGYMVFGSFLWALKYTAAAILIFTVLVVFRDTAVYGSSWFMPLSASVVVACVSYVAAYEAGWAISATALMMSDTVLAGACAYFYRRALSPWRGNFDYDSNSETLHAVSVLILVSTLLISLSDFMLFEIVSAGRLAATLAVFLTAYVGGVGIGCTAGVALGLAMDAASGGTAIFAVAYGFSGLISGVFSKRGKLPFAVTFIFVGAAAALLSPQNPAVPSILYESFGASVIFMLLPASVMSRLAALLPRSVSGIGALKAREYSKRRIEQASDAFRDLYETVKEKTGSERNDADIVTIFDRAAEAVCRKCPGASNCWQTNYQTTLDAVNNAAPVMLRRGRLERSDFPDYFIDECEKPTELVAAINTELRSLLYRRQYRNRLRENQNAAFNQYSEVSEILSEISHELGEGVTLEPELEERLGKYLQTRGIMADTAVFRDRGGRLHAEITGAGVTALKKDAAYLEKLSAALGVRICTSERSQTGEKLLLLEAEPLSAAVGISCLKKAGQEISGDKGAYFKTDEGVLYVILSDGMGTGRLAAQCSGDAVRILERFLRSGVAAETAVRMLNDLFLLKNEDDTGCATIDLVSINLFTGETGMYKYGAAPSYLKGGDGIRRVRGSSLAAGLGTPPNNCPDKVMMQLKPDSVAVIVSDGVITGTDDGWLEDILMNYDGAESPRELSKLIIDEAVRKSGNDDDMTVITIQMSRRD